MAPQLFDKSKISESLVCRDVGRVPERPFVIKAAIRETSLGDLMSKLLFLATIKNQFDYGELVLHYRDVRAYSKEVVSLIPEIDHSVGVKWHIPRWARLGFPDARLWHPLARAIDGNKWSWPYYCDFYPTDWMADARRLHAFPYTAILRIPDHLEDSLKQQLISHGVKEDRWLATLHYRASTYLNKRSGHIRNSDPQSFQKLIDYIIDDLGGQAVLLGHPELKAFPAREGFVDLSRIPKSFLLQAYAVRNARFMMAGPSGPLILGRGFHIPNVLVDASDSVAGWAPVEDRMLTHEVTTPDGRVLQNRALYEEGLLDYALMRDKIRAGENYKIRKNSIAELSAVADHLYSVTSDMVGWRPPAPAYDGPRPNHFIWPPQTGENLRFLDV